jgi:molecular chaperone GrpE (heat shock protein)
MPSDDMHRELGRSMAQVHLKLSRILDRVEAIPSPAEGAPAELDALLDLIDAVDAALERRPRARNGRGWFRRPESGSADVWRGLAVAVAQARERLLRAGIEPAPVDGPFDPTLHQAIEVVPAGPTGVEGTLAATHRRGWLKRRGSERAVLRTAHVSVHGAQR